SKSGKGSFSPPSPQLRCSRHAWVYPATIAAPIAGKRPASSRPPAPMATDVIACRAAAAKPLNSISPAQSRVPRAQHEHGEGTWFYAAVSAGVLKRSAEKENWLVGGRWSVLVPRVLPGNER